MTTELTSKVDTGFGFNYSQSTSFISKLYDLIHADWQSHSKTGNCFFTKPTWGWKNPISSTRVIICDKKIKEMWRTTEWKQGAERRIIKPQRSYGDKYGRKEWTRTVWTGYWETSKTGCHGNIKRSRSILTGSFIILLMCLIHFTADYILDIYIVCESSSSLNSGCLFFFRDLEGSGSSFK